MWTDPNITRGVRGFRSWLRLNAEADFALNWNWKNGHRPASCFATRGRLSRALDGSAWIFWGVLTFSTDILMQPLLTPPSDFSAKNWKIHYLCFMLKTVEILHHIGWLGVPIFDQKPVHQYRVCNNSAASYFFFGKKSNEIFFSQKKVWSCGVIAVSVLIYRFLVPFLTTRSQLRCRSRLKSRRFWPEGCGDYRGGFIGFWREIPSDFQNKCRGLYFFSQKLF